MATRNRNIGYTGQPYREDPERDVLWARPDVPPGGNVTTERQWQDRSTVGEGDLEQRGKDIDNDNNTPSYADYVKRDDSSPSGYTVVTGGGVKGSKNKADKAQSQGYGVGVDGNAGASGVGTSNTPSRTGGSIFKKATDKVGDAIDDSKRAIDRAANAARYEDIERRMNETYGRNKTRLEEEEKRARRNRLMYGIGDVFNAMHRAYAHSRGIQAMPGSERQMSDKARERYDKIVARREKLDEDYANFLLKLQNARTMSDRYAALDEWRKDKNKIDKQKVDNQADAEAQKAQKAEEERKRKEEEARKKEEERKRKEEEDKKRKDRESAARISNINNQIHNRNRRTSIAQQKANDKEQKNSGGGAVIGSAGKQKPKNTGVNWVKRNN